MGLTLRGFPQTMESLQHHSSSGGLVGKRGTKLSSRVVGYPLPFPMLTWRKGGLACRGVN